MAKVCMICEGAYPYVVGGVSSWVDDFIRTNGEHEFTLLCLIPKEEFAVRRYELPKNVVEVKNILLNPQMDASSMRIMRNNLSKREAWEDEIEEAMDFKSIDPRRSLEIMDRVVGEGFGNPFEIVASKLFWKALENHYKKGYENTNYNIFYWTYRNIFLNLFALMEIEIPEAEIYHSVATGYAGFIASVAGYRGMGKVILTEHGIYPREREEEILNAPWIEKDFKEIWVEFFYYLSRVAYYYSHNVISLFDYNKRFQIEFGALPEKCEVIPNGVDIRRFERIKREERVGFNVGAVLRVVPIKDVKMMLKAIKVAKRKVHNARFYLIGPTDENKDYYRECMLLVRGLGMEDYVEFTGEADVDNYYSFLDLLLLTSISEGQPLCILEGLAAGIPVIATDVGNCREILTEKRKIGEAGIVVPPTSYTTFAEAIVKLYQNRDRLRILGENGRKIVKAHYPREKSVNRYKRIYERLGEDTWQE
ncbi:LPS N-acetylglucosaminyltransferase [Propionigenium maris DSM 9537]|uniref:LPS N-acetylglucosaminyltransferase n=1 Tax=Propionigenium maris DSM 9537 TaxID=1123000 RepID=A0A9W6GMR8_9FUSO|nr:GT4 family glycosyltransferase PelF [Propionigenium maris]GLI56684.1 LPS N-acetylglucosaminyltransferase [Propionigenium maris DSM 9537]